jgi:hypothetical protein
LIFNIKGSKPNTTIKTGLDFRPITPSFQFTKKLKIKNLKIKLKKI